MDNTPKSYQCSSESGYFDSSQSLFESTPNADSNSTPLFSVSRKRKAPFLENCNTRKLTDVIEACPMSPPFSSTFNESFMNDLEKFHIQAEKICGDLEKGHTVGSESSEKSYHASKIFRMGAHNKIRSAPNTPERQIRTATKRASTSSFIKNFSHIKMQSPLNEEAYGILYPALPPLEMCRRLSTPQKLSEHQEKVAAPANKCLFVMSCRELFREVFSNTIIVSYIFQYLSDGDLYRLSLTSRFLKESLTLDMVAYERYRRFLYEHKSSKENYRITPPKSPGKENNVAEANSASKNFYYFYEFASELNKNQSLIKCPRCSKPSIVENSIGQCQDINSCGYIFCQKCSSFANNPKDFKDKCNNAQLLNCRPRSRLGDLSNSTVTSDYVTDSGSSFFSSSSLNLSLSNRYDSSGFFSECEGTTPVQRVKRNLSNSFTSSSEFKPRALSSNNNNNRSNRTMSHPHRPQRRASLLPVVPLDVSTKVAEIIEPSSPPKIKSYSACSKQSKRNLKRLTR